MKPKTINKTIKAKIDSWLESITDIKLKEELKSGVIVTGGCITSMLLQEPVNDYDVYINSRDLLVDLSKYYINKMNLDSQGAKVVIEDNRVKIYIKSAGVAGNMPVNEDGETVTPEETPDQKPGEKFKPVFITSNAITLSNKLQIIVRFYGPPHEIHSNYDFVHCTNYWIYDTGCVFNTPALLATLSRELVYTGSKYPLCSVIRARKFIKRNWSINAGQYLKMILQLNKLDLTDMAVLEDQLVGVDTTYFLQFIRLIEEQGGIENLESTYINEVISQIFDEAELPAPVMRA